jgi:hypothetical protein
LSWHSRLPLVHSPPKGPLGHQGRRWLTAEEARTVRSHVQAPVGSTIQNAVAME